MLFLGTVKYCLPRMSFPHPKWQRILGAKSLPVKIKFSDASDSACDAFCQGLRFTNNWLCPPDCLIARVIRLLELCQARGTLIVPLRKSSFFRNSCSKGNSLEHIVMDWEYFPKLQGLFIKGKARNSFFGSRSLALRIDFSRLRPPSSLRGYCTLPPNKCSSCS